MKYVIIVKVSRMKEKEKDMNREGEKGKEGGGVNMLIITRKMVPITGRASTFLEIFENSNLNPN